MKAKHKMKTLKTLLQGGSPVLSGWSSIGSPYSAEVMAKTGFDTVVVDMQHSLATEADVLHCLQGIQAGGAIPMARSRWNEPSSIMRLLDLGAMGIICPMTNTKAEAECFVKACRYSPKGNRSFGPIRAGVAYGADYYKNANDSVQTMAMIETKQALENVQDILSVDGLDGLFIGPNDLGVDLGQGPVLDGDNKVLDDAIEHIVTCANQVGKYVGIFCGTPEGAKKRIAQGCNFVSLGNDGMYLKTMAQSMYNAMKKDAQ